jgi:hypothetical protein
MSARLCSGARDPRPAHTAFTRRLRLAAYLLAVAMPAVAASGAPAKGADRLSSAPFVVTPVVLSSSDADVDAAGPQVALDAGGDAFAIWSEIRPTGTTTLAAMRPRGGGWGDAVPLAAGAFGRMAVDPRGDVVVAGLVAGATSGRVFVVYRPAGGRFGPTRLLPGAWGGNSLPTVAIDGAGRALVAWSDGTHARVASRAPGGRWLSRVLGTGVDPVVAMNRRGDALRLWRTETYTVDRFVGSWRLRGKQWRRPRTLVALGKGPGALPLAPRLALDNAGNSLAVFPVFDCACSVTSVVAAVGRRGRALAAPRTVAAGGDRWFQLAAAPDGRATIVSVAGGSGSSLWASSRPGARHGFSPAVEVEKQDALAPAAGVATAGTLAVWAQASGSSLDPGPLTLAGALGRPDGSYTQPSTLGPIGGDCWMHRCRIGGAPSVALAPDGNGVVAWVEKQDPTSNGGGEVVAADVSLGSLRPSGVVQATTR